MKTLVAAAGIFLSTGVASSAAELRDVEIKYYDCSAPTVRKHDGKCVIAIMVEQQSIELTASPEVGAPWSASYGDSNCHPMSRLQVSVTDRGEIWSIKDSKGTKISNKIDYSR